MLLETIDDGMIVICAVRYALPRESSMPSLVQSWLNAHWSQLAQNTKEIIIRDVKEAIHDDQAGSAPDKAMWQQLVYGLEGK